MKRGDILTSAMIRNRFVAIYNCLSTQSSEEYPLTLSEIQEHLENQEIHLESKAIRTELKHLETMDVPFQIVKGKNRLNHKENVYHIKKRTFELHELRYLMDAVSAARFISPRETEQMIIKLRGLIDEKNAERLGNELVNSEGKVSSPDFAENVQTIHEAIKSKSSLTFQYGHYNLNKEFVLRRNDEFYEVSAFGVIWNQENYYLIALESDKEVKVHYRIDRMRNVSKTGNTMRDEPGFNLETYVSKLFHMYSGDMSGIGIEFDNHLINVVIDRFGVNAKIKQINRQKFLLEIEGVVSMGLVRWLLTWGADAKAVRPQKLIDLMKKEIERYDGLYT